MSSVHWERSVPDEISGHDTLVNPDYADVFFGWVAAPTVRSPEAWARALIQDAPLRLRVLLRVAVLVQTNLLGLRLSRRPSPDHFLGWRIAARGDHWFRLEAASWFGVAHLVFHFDRRRVSVATFIRYDHRLSRLIWLPVSYGHRHVGLAILRYAVSAPSLRMSPQAAWLH